MDSKLYEELCRRFVSDKFVVPLASISSPRLPNPRRTELPEYRHQIDLYWEVESEVALYLHIANAKWRGSEKIDLPDVLLLQQVRQKVAAHKALLIASSDFTAGAIAAAKDDGIGLHIVRPGFDCSGFPTSDRGAMQVALAGVAASELYTHTIVHRGFDLAASPAPVAPALRPAPTRTTRAQTGETTRGGLGTGYANRQLGGGSGLGGGGIVTRNGGGFTRGGGGGGGFTRR